MRSSKTTIIVACVAVIVVVNLLVGLIVPGEPTEDQKRRISRQRLEEFDEGVKQVKNGELPKLSSNGDPTHDALVPVENAFLHDLLEFGNELASEIATLQRSNIRSPSVLGKKSAIESEIQKALEEQKIVERYQNKLPLLIASSKERMNSVDVSAKLKKAAIAEWSNSLDRREANTGRMLALLYKLTGNEAEYLQFMVLAFDDYQVNDGKISFNTNENIEKYRGFQRSMDELVGDLKALQKSELESADKIRTDLANDAK